ncbi:hypothetical protein [Novosphingobium album (ex Hu et al. 2023)]|uniref:Tetratricopeptide repeat protein n=1 Tax=Novosphingobium album (ex Hu et al. 2023) TaxID=2930093 RepID=A0ABT0B2Q6_9SPHN|nr:hypothetical protein [Novosphingobium album (ex Hu et al. 2023)]MCJ2179206.1 hypothetical protein [Novosphingobium album (ex Hu et al. 2023)]
MPLTALMTAALLGQSAFSLAVEAPPADKVQDVAYEELASGRSEAALHKLEASDAVRTGDPAALINLGAAYAGEGQTAKAIATYRTAIASRDRYDLELADGSWMDSRLAARTALSRLLVSTAQASR